MYRNCVTLADDGRESWRTRFISWRAHEMIFNASEDKDLWTDPDAKKFFAPEIVLGQEVEDPLRLLKAMQAAGFMPVYEGKHVEQFIFGMKPIRWWLKREQAKRSMGVIRMANHFLCIAKPPAIPISELASLPSRPRLPLRRTSSRDSYRRELTRKRRSLC